jgi:hypothetical protein
VKKVLLVFVSIVFSLNIFSQDVIKSTDDSKWKKFVKKNTGVSGNFGIASMFYSSTDTAATRPPFFYQINGNLNVTAGPINIPLSISYSPQGYVYQNPTLPFNQIGISPNYKDWTFHAGFSSVNFSEFSLAGNQFTGGGVEYLPANKLLNVKALYGRFSRADIQFDANNVILGVPAYERWGGGVSISLGGKKGRTGLVVFKAKDGSNSIYTRGNNLDVTPSENLVYGLTTQQRISKRISFEGELMYSAFTNDVRYGEELMPGYTLLNNLGDLFTYNTTSNLNKAVLANVKYKAKKYGLKLGYRRVDPDYKSLGAVFLNNDLEDITLGVSTKFFRSKLGVNLKGGLQRNNLNQEKITRTTRKIGSVALSYVPNENWSFSGNYANFTTNTNMVLVPESIDTLRYAQVTHSQNLNATRTFRREKLTHTIMGMASYQEAIANGARNTQTYVSNLSYTSTVNRINLNVTLAASLSKNISKNGENTNKGPTLAITKPLFKQKASATVGGAYLLSYQNSVRSGKILNVRSAFNYKVGKHQTITLSASIVQRQTAVKEVTETIATAAYLFSF